MKLSFRTLSEALPGEKWKSAFAKLWPLYREWFRSQGDAARPTYTECEEAVRRYVPRFARTWQALCELAGGGDEASRFLSLWRPPEIIQGCSQAAWLDGEPLLVRNYDYAPWLFEAIVLRSAWHGRSVIAVTDCLVGALDGMNDAGLCVSLAFGGRQGSAPGFGAQMVLRQLLEFCDSTSEALALLRRVPTHVAYNLLLVDRQGDFATALVRAGGGVVARRVPVSTNHQGRVSWVEHAQATASVDRERRLLALLADPDITRDEFIAAFLDSPLHARNFARGRGTLYTAVYRPRRGELTLHWPGDQLKVSFDRFREGQHAVAVPDAAPVG